MTTPIQPKRMSEELRAQTEGLAANVRNCDNARLYAHILAVEAELADRTRSYTEANKAATFYAQSYQRVLDELAEAVGLLKEMLAARKESEKTYADYQIGAAGMLNLKACEDRRIANQQKAAAFVARQEGKTNE